MTLSRFAYQLIFRLFIAEFGARYPHIQLELSLCDGTINILDAGYDLGIRFGDTLEEGMVAAACCRPSRKASTPPRNTSPATARRRPRTTSSGTAFIGYRYITANRLLPLTLDADGEPLGVAMPTPLICNDIDVTADAIRASLGIGRLFAPICARLPDRERFRPVLRDYWKTYPGVYLYHLPHAQKARRVQALIAFLTEKTATIELA